MRIPRALAALTLALSVALTACGSDEPDQQPEVSSTEHNDADVTFATDMIPHHAQALSMADMTSGRQLDPEVSALVEDIRNAQTPEVEVMVDWLTDWNEEVPETMRDHGNAGHGDSDPAEQMQDMDDMPGMMTAKEMTALADAPDDEFQQMWLTMMIEHHEGALTMAETQKTDGRFKPALDLADDIISAQKSEISAMNSLLS